MSTDESWDKSFRGFFNVFMIENHCLSNFCSSETEHNKIANSNMKKNCIDFDMYLIYICLHADRI